MLNISEQQLRSWERQGIIPAAEIFSFGDLIALRAFKALRENRIPSKKIGRALESIKHLLPGVPLAEMRLLPDGRRIAVQLAGERMEPITGQLLFNFDPAQSAVKTLAPRPAPPEQRERDAEIWFQRGLAMEETGAPIEHAIEAYEKAIDLNPNAAGALVNLGTIDYRRGKLRSAEQYYQRAATVDPNYALAQFNLGNLYDELGNATGAQKHYHRALELNPDYADAHFNLALLMERNGDIMAAVRHWKSYLRFDNTSSWAEIARRELDKLKQNAVIPGIKGESAPGE